MSADEDHPAERRHFTRIAIDAPARLNDAGGEWLVEVIDLSLNGVLVALPEGAPVNGICRLSIELSPEVAIHMEVEPAHREASRAGFYCRYIDLDSVSHLRRLVELNTGDPELLQRELAELAGD